MPTLGVNGRHLHFFTQTGHRATFGLHPKLHDLEAALTASRRVSSAYTVDGGFQ
jgi:hypothetical protein